MPSQSRYEFQQEASLSQQLSKTVPEYQEYAGADPEISESLAILNALIKLKIINPKDESIIMLKTILNERRKAAFATSERVNEVTKLGLQMPKGRDIINVSK